MLMVFKDARIYQIIFLLLFLALGLGTRDWTLQPFSIALILTTCLTTQAIATRLIAVPFQFLTFLSPLITALGLSLLLRADDYSTLIIASMSAIASKFLLRVGDRHLFNPGNFGIVMALLFTDAWVSPGQWGEEGWYGLLFLAAGGVVLQRVGRWDTSVAFLVSYAGLEAVRNAWLGWTWDVWAHRLMSGSLLIFALFMITDPRTIPSHRIARMIWVMAIAILAFILRNRFFIPEAVFYALFALSPLTVLLNLLFPADRFQWDVSSSTDLVSTSETI
jgi:Na+-transporting NADH:ubiquinone oxidoreductase subunit NqrB